MQDPYDLAWLIVSATRQTLSLGYRQPQSYSLAGAVAVELAPHLFTHAAELLEDLEGTLTRLYRERAEAKSRSLGRDISPVTLIDEDIRQYMTEARDLPRRERRAIDSQIGRLQRVRAILDEDRFTETQTIRRDSDAALNYGMFLPISERGKDYREYALAADRWLRIRLLHPDPAEWNTGVDLIYEQYWQPSYSRSLLVRIAALQYKTWDGKCIYTSGKNKRILDQVETATTFFCNNGLCEPPDANTPIYALSTPYRFSHCSAFLRPTDKNQSRRQPMATRGWHAPLCHVRTSYKETNQGNKSIDARYIERFSLNHNDFNSLFNRAMLGSRWLESDTLEAIYQRGNFFTDAKQPVLHAQEYVYGYGDASPGF